MTTPTTFRFTARLGSTPLELEFPLPPSNIFLGRTNLITGVTGSGKTTILRQLAEAVRFNTPENRSPGLLNKLDPVTISNDPLSALTPAGPVWPNHLEEISEAQGRIDTPDKRRPFDNALTFLENETSFKLIHPQGAVLSQEALHTWPKGHLLTLRVIVQLAAGLHPGALALIDRPEEGLHPPLQAALCRAIHSLLEDTGSTAIIATNSPTFLQATPAAQINILTRYGNLTKARRPPIETFAESLALITHHVLHFDPTTANHHASLRALAADHTLDEIDLMFTNGMSSQARALIMHHQHKDRNHNPAPEGDSE